MADQRKTKAQLIDELNELRSRVGELEAAAAEESRSDSKLREDEDHFRRLFERAPLGYQSLDSEGCFIEVNPAWLETLGYERNEVIGKWFGDFLAPEFVAHFRESFPRFKRIGEVRDVQFEMIRKDDSRVTVSFNGRIGYDQAGNFQQTHCVLHDITEEACSKQRLQESEEKFAAAFQSGVVLMAISTLDEGRFIDINNEFLHLLGYEREEVLGRTSTELSLFWDEDQRDVVVQAVRKQGHARNVDVDVRTKSGARLHGIFSVDTISLQGRQCLLTALVDVTRRTQAENLTRLQSDLARALSVASTVEEVLELSLETAIESGGMDSGGFYLVDLESDMARLAYHRGLSDEFVSDSSQYAADSAQGRVVAAGQPLYRVEEHVDELSSDAQRSEAITALAVLPVKHDDTVIGCINVASHSLTEIPYPARDALEAIAAEVGSAISRLRGRESLRESETRYRMMFSNTPNAVAVYQAVDDGEDFVFVDFNQAGENVDKVRREDLIGRKVTEAFLGVEEFGLLDVFRRVWKTGQSEQHPVSIYEDDRITAWRENYVYKLPSGEIVAIYEDVTGQKQAEMALNLSEEKYRTLVNNLPVGVYRSTPEGKVLSVNPALAKMLGHEYEREYLDKPAVESYVSPHRRAELIALLEKDGSVSGFESQMIRKDGSIAWISTSAHAVTDADGRIQYIDGIEEDITQRKQAEEALGDSQRRYQEIFDTVQEGIVYSDVNQIVRFANPAVAEILEEASVDLVVGRSLFDYIPDDQRHVFEDQIELRREAGQTSRYEIRIETAKGNQRTICVSATPRLDQDGKFSGSVAAVQDITESKQAENQRRAEKFFTETVMQSVPGLFYMFEKKSGRFVRRNTNWEAVTGFSSEEVDSKTALDFFSDGFDRNKSAYTLSEVYRTGYATMENYLQTKSGEKIPYYFTGLAVNIEDQTYLVGMGLDITQRKKAEAALQVSEQRFRELSDLLPQAVYEMDLTGKLLYLNRYGLELINYSTDEIKAGVTVLDLCSPKDRDRLAHDVGVVATGQRLLGTEYTFVRGDGSTYELATYSNAIYEDDQVVGIRGIAVDVTERKAADNEIRKFKTIFDSAPYGTAIADLQGKILYLNDHCAKMHGYSPEELLGKNLSTFHSDEQMPEVKRLLRALIHQGSFPSVEVMHCHRDGRDIPTLMTGVAIRDEDGEPQYYASTAVDISETKRLQEFAERAQRLETAGRIAGQVAHDFNNLLGPLVAYPEFVKEALGAESEAIAYLDAMESAADQMADINQQLLTLGRRGHYNLEPLSLNRVVRQVIKQLHPRPSTLNIETELCDDLMNVNAGASQIFRVITNLVSNAVDATDGIGNVSMKSENWYADDVEGNYRQIPRGEYVKLTVSDTGCGIPAEVQAKIFEPFFTTKKAGSRRGSGLGLSVVHAVVQDHDGYLDLESTVGVGTSVYLYLPITREKSLESAKRSAATGSERILVVDDDQIQRDVTSMLLKKLGYRVDAASSGEQAVECLKRGKRDLVLLDMIMPGGIDGTETFRRAVLIQPDLKAVIVSGYAESGRVGVAQALGAGSFLKKPLTLQSIATAVRSELDKTKSPAQAS